ESTTETRQPSGANDTGPRVGYGKPPLQNRFQKGRSGNPRGKRKGTQSLLTVFKKVVSEKVKVQVAGEERRMTRAEYVLRTNYMAVWRRNPNAMSNMLQVAELAGRLVDVEQLKRAGVPIARSQSLSTDEFELLFGNAVPTARRPDDTNGPKP